MESELGPTLTQSCSTVCNIDSADGGSSIVITCAWTLELEVTGLKGSGIYFIEFYECLHLRSKIEFGGVRKAILTFHRLSAVSRSRSRSPRALLPPLSFPSLSLPLLLPPFPLPRRVSLTFPPPDSRYRGGPRVKPNDKREKLEAIEVVREEEEIPALLMLQCGRLALEPQRK